MKADTRYKSTGNRLTYEVTRRLLSFLVLILTGCGLPEDNQQEAEEEEFSIVGTWELNELRFLSGQRVDVRTGYEYVWYRFLEEDGTYYVVELNIRDKKKPLKPHEMSEYFFMMSPYDTVYIEHGRMRDITIIDNHTIGIDRGAYVEIFIKNDKLPADMVSEIERSVETAFRPNHNKNTQYIMPTSATTGNSHIWIWVAVPIVLLIISLYIRYKVRGKRNQPSSMDGNTGTIMEDRHSEQAFIHSDYYLTLRRRLYEEPPLKPDEWKELETQMKSAYPQFFRNLTEKCQLSEVELRVCILTKLGIPPSAIAIHTCREYSSISSIRSRLYYKMFGKKGGAKDLDEYIINL